MIKTLINLSKTATIWFLSLASHKSRADSRVISTGDMKRIAGASASDKTIVEAKIRY